MNRAIRARGLSTIFVTGPGHGGPGLVAGAYLDGTYSEVYPHIGRDEEGLRRLVRQFSFPGGIPSHVAPETPGSIHEGGELGYSLLHSYGAVFDNPGLLALCMLGDGQAETGPLAASQHSNKFLDPARDGAVLPVPHVNGYKIANPPVPPRQHLARDRHTDHRPTGLTNPPHISFRGVRVLVVNPASNRVKLSGSAMARSCWSSASSRLRRRPRDHRRGHHGQDALNGARARISRSPPRSPGVLAGSRVI
jgi:XFP N-terminal domain